MSGDEVQSKGPVYGLALTVPPVHEWPSPAEFGEGRESVREWYEVIAANYTALLSGCPWPPALPDSWLDLPVAHTIRSTSGQCGFDEATIDAAINRVLTGDEQILTAWRLSAIEQMNESRTAIDAIGSYRNVATVQVVRFVMLNHLAANATLGFADSAFREYLEAGDPQSLRLALAGYWQASSGARIAMRTANLVEVGSHDCRLAIGVDHSEEVHSRLHDILRLHDSALPDGRLDPMYGVVESALLSAERGHDLGWWPLDLGALSALPYYEAYFVYRESERLPTFQEALWLRAVSLATQRSIFTDSVFERSFNYGGVEQRNWEREPDWAWKIMAVGHLDWRFDEVTCGPLVS